MTEAILKRAIGAAVFAAILVVFVPRFFQGSGDFLQFSEPLVDEVSSFDLITRKIVEKRAEAEHNRLLTSVGNQARTSARKVVDESSDNYVVRQIAVEVQSDTGSNNQISTQSNSQQLVADSAMPLVDELAVVTPSVSIAEQIKQTQLTTSQNNVELADDNAVDKSTENQQPTEQQSAEQQSAEQQQASIDADIDDLGDFIRQQRLASAWVVRVGVFDISGNANRLIEKMKNDEDIGAGFVREVVVSGKKYTGAFAGPFASKARAEFAQKAIFDTFDLKGELQPYRDGVD